MDHTYKILFTSVSILLGILHRRYEAQDRVKSISLKNVEDTLPYILEYDYIVIGGGAAGSIVTNKLSENNTVLLLEHGGNPLYPTFVPAYFQIYHKSNETAHNWYSVKQTTASLKVKNGSTLISQGKGLGGSTQINGMIYNRGNPLDYDNWANITDDQSWSYENLLPYFKMNENFYEETAENNDHLGLSGPLFISLGETTMSSDELNILEKFKEAGKSLGYETFSNPNSPQIEGFGGISFTRKKGRRYSAYSAFIEPILDRKTLTISRYSIVKKIEIDESMTARGVFYSHHGLEKFAKAKKEVIVSAGAMNSPLLLMKSGIGPEALLKEAGIEVKKDLPVGQNFQDHPLIFLKYYYLNEDPYKKNGQDEIKDFVENGKGTFSNVLSILGQAFLVSKEAKKEGNNKWPDIQIMINHFSESVDQRNNSLFLMIGIGRPTSRGNLKLDLSDPLNKPLIYDPGYIKTQRDLNVYIEAIKIGEKLLESEAIKNLGGRYIKTECYGKDFNSDAYYECIARATTETFFNPGSSCKMGKEGDANAVVDTQLRVKGIKNLRVIDNSIIPQITNANAMAPAYVIGQKGVEMILKENESRK